MEIVVLIVLFGLIFDYTNGLHDAANVVSTVIATKALRPIIAILMAAILNFIGATQVSGVAETIATGIVDPYFATEKVVLCAVIGAICWNLFTWFLGIPSSSSYALIGGLTGASLVNNGISSVIWKGIVSKVLLPMIFSPLIGFIIALCMMKLLYSYLTKNPTAKEQKFFRHLQIGSACFVALAHGMNDAQKSMGLITLGLFTGGYLPHLHTPLWVILSCAIVIGLGTASGGFRIIRTMAFSITKISSVQGFAAESSASIVILLASILGMPISSTQVITGGITGVGVAKGMKAVRWKTPKKLVTAWIFTLPGSGLVGALAYHLITLF